MLPAARRILPYLTVPVLTLFLSASHLSGQAAIPAAQAEADHLKSTIKTVPLADWRYSGFETVDGTDAHRAPWSPFINAKLGYVADFINPSRDIQNTGKGGNADGSRHPQFSLWIFPKTPENTPEHFEQMILSHQMVQSSIPRVIGSGKSYVLACVGDVDEAQSQIAKLAAAFEVPPKGGR